MAAFNSIGKRVWRAIVRATDIIMLSGWLLTAASIVTFTLGGIIYFGFQAGPVFGWAPIIISCLIAIKAIDAWLGK